MCHPLPCPNYKPVRDKVQNIPSERSGQRFANCLDTIRLFQRNKGFKLTLQQRTTQRKLCIYEPEISGRNNDRANAVSNMIFN